jgi:hypothetical protein
MPNEMTDSARPPAEASAPLPDVILYSRDGCHLCDEAREILGKLLEERAADGRGVPRLVERDIRREPAWERAFSTTIPVVELGERRLVLATSPVRLRRLLDQGIPDEGIPEPAPS